MAGHRRGNASPIDRRRRVGLLALLLVTIVPARAHVADKDRLVCSIDLGSNSFKRIVGSFTAGRYKQIDIEKKTLGVGDDLTRNGKISDAKLAEIEATLVEFKASCARQGTASIVAIGTAAFREAPNGTHVVEVARKLGIPMEIATEKRESELGYLAGTLGQNGYAVIDNGSRSIELASKEARQDVRYSVFDLGYRVAYDKFFATAERALPEIRALRELVKREAAQGGFMKEKQRLIGVEFDEMVDVFFKSFKKKGDALKLNVLKRKLSEIEASSAEEFQALKKIKDIDRALPRLVVAVTLMEEFGYSAISLTSRELGSGLIIEAGSKNR